MTKENQKKQEDKVKGEKLRNEAMLRLKERNCNTPRTQDSPTCSNSDGETTPKKHSKRINLPEVLEERNKERAIRFEAEMDLKRRKLEVEERRVASQERQLELLIALVQKDAK